MAKTHSNKTPNKQLETKRVPAGYSQDVMEVIDKDPDFRYRHVNDTKNGSNFARFLRGTYSFVEKEDAEVTGDKSEHTKHAQQNSLDVGSGVKSCLMRIPKKLYKEDQAAKQKEQDARMDIITNRAAAEGAVDNEYTKYKVQQNKTKVEKYYGKRRST